MKLRKEHALPVTDVGRIFAHKEQLDDWVKKNRDR